MTTQERLDRYRLLLATSKEEAQAFAQKQGKIDKRFASVVDLHCTLLGAFRDRYVSGDPDS